MATEIKFGTDGWRGVIAWDFTYENVRRIAQALADYINENAPSEDEGKSSKIFVGYDRRFMSDIFAADIASILRSNKIDVTLSACAVTTPMVSMLTLKKFWLGIMVTASHNPAQYNGVKVKLAGCSAPIRETKEIERNVDENPVLFLYGQKAEQKNLTDLYQKHLSSIANLKKIATLKGNIAVDYMYGSTAGWLEKLLPSNKIVALHEEHDPTFKGLQPDPALKNLADLKKLVLEKKAIAGFAFDGDGDRFGLIDEKGNYVTPCYVAAVLLHHLSKTKKLKGKVVQTVSMGYLPKRIARSLGLSFEEVPVGFKNVAELMGLEEVAFGVEEAGGFAWKGGASDRDGLAVALAWLEILATTKKKVSELCDEVAKEYGSSVYLRRDLPAAKPIDKAAFEDKLRRKLPKKVGTFKLAEVSTLDGVKIYFENDEWLLVRPSGTEPLVRVYAEAATKKDTQLLLDFGEKLVAPYIK
ncbi:MAG: hypothetical protein IKC13_01065 [Elusimicrobiaceae bacterium]|nr:hypothetical protein [Elusimicrobiaceae bacterium]